MRGTGLAGLALVGLLSAAGTLRPGALEADPPEATVRSEAPEPSNPEAEPAARPKPRAHLLYLHYDRDPIVIGDYREEEGQIVFEKYGGQIKIPKAQVLRIVPDQPGAPAFSREPVPPLLQGGFTHPRPRGGVTHYLSLRSGGHLKVSEVRPEGDRLRVVLDEGSFTIPATEVVAILRISAGGAAKSEAWLLVTRGGTGPASPLLLAPPPPPFAVEPSPPMVASVPALPEPADSPPVAAAPRVAVPEPSPAPDPEPTPPILTAPEPTPAPAAPVAPPDRVAPPSPPPVSLAALPPTPPESPEVERGLAVRSSHRPHLLEMVSGKTIRVEGFWIEDGEVKFRRFGGMVGVALSEVLTLIPEAPRLSSERLPVRLLRLLGPTLLEVRVKGKARQVRLLGIEPLTELDPSRDPWRRLQRGAVLQLEFDRERETDSHWLAYVFLPSGRMLNAELVRLGLARPTVDPRALKHLDLFHELAGRPARQ